MFISADRLIGFARRAFPATGIYGDDKGGDAGKIIRFLGDKVEMQRVSDGLWNVDFEYNRATKQHYEAIRAADEIRLKAEKALLGTIKQGPMSPAPHTEAIDG